ncbi:MAG: SRPBCC family protein [Paludibacteraceae bacterium]|nr:SRPBCC family protein [Paludibacteraceae bacterium]
MSETKYESKIQSIPASAAQVYSVLSNLKNLDRVKDLIPQDKVQELEIEEDAVRMKVDGLGQKICIRIVDKIENDTIKFGAENIPMQMNFWIQLKEVTPQDTRVKLTLKADIPMMFKMMLNKKIQQGIDDAAVMLTQFPFPQWANA